jgi:hypothetical protein
LDILWIYYDAGGAWPFPLEIIFIFVCRFHDLGCNGRGAV